MLALGNSGTGKTLALALGLAACQKGYRAATAAALVNELLEARDEKRLLRVQRQLARQDLSDLSTSCRLNVEAPATARARQTGRVRARRVRRPGPSCCSRSSPSATSKRPRW